MAWFVELADRHGAIVLAPLFPVGIPDGEDDGAYKRLAAHGLRFDLVLLAMIEDAARTWRIETERFFLFGFSGGGHFAHRFLLVHPQRLCGVSVAAPGIVTLPVAEHSWWVGTADMVTVFGRSLDRNALARVPVHAVVGEDDTETWEITPQPGGVWDRPEYRLAGADRPARLAALVEALRDLGTDVLHESVPGVAHQGAPLAARACNFFDRLLAGPDSMEEPG
ncbi:alpha/beta hydrolase [Muricoccus radiodurans]|uniref:alpha/beta hydrolase n=1 Tax=Muricoccus radiodurans TaxID=2231721 RepID=UPI003CF26B87